MRVGVGVELDRAYGHGALRGGGSAPKFRSGAAGVQLAPAMSAGPAVPTTAFPQFHGDVSCDALSSQGGSSWSQFCGSHVAQNCR